MGPAHIRRFGPQRLQRVSEDIPAGAFLVPSSGARVIHSGLIGGFVTTRLRPLWITHESGEPPKGVGNLSDPGVGNIVTLDNWDGLPWWDSALLHLNFT